jgi:hypothetical protein
MSEPGKTSREIHMKLKSMMPMPWDMVVFLTITTVGFGFSVQKLHYSKANRILDSAVEDQQQPNEEEVVSSGPGGQILDLGCLEQKLGRERVTGQEGSIRIKGKFCNLTKKEMRAFEGVKIKNMTNGYEGTIFFHGLDSSFVTDHMVLESGKNLIQVEWRESPKVDPKQYLTEVFIK